jgi:hypothetical protein
MAPHYPRCRPQTDQTLNHQSLADQSLTRQSLARQREAVVKHAHSGAGLHHNLWTHHMHLSISVIWQDHYRR